MSNFNARDGDPCISFYQQQQQSATEKKGIGPLRPHFFSLTTTYLIILFLYYIL
jgi:hypothetical protein